MKILQETTVVRNRFYIRLVFDAFFDLIISNETIGEAEKVVIGSLIKNLLAEIILELEAIIYWELKTRYDSRLLRRRSIIQFFYDEFGSVVVDGEPLEIILNRKGIKKMINQMNKRIKKIDRNRNNKKKRSSDSESDDSVYDWDDVAKQVPATHRQWWCKK